MSWACRGAGRRLARGRIDGGAGFGLKGNTWPRTQGMVVAQWMGVAGGRRARATLAVVLIDGLGPRLYFATLESPIECTWPLATFFTIGSSHFS